MEMVNTYQTNKKMSLMDQIFSKLQVKTPFFSSFEEKNLNVNGLSSDFVIELESFERIERIG